MKEDELDVCPLCGGNIDAVEFPDDRTEVRYCQLCGKYKLKVEWTSPSSYIILEKIELKKPHYYGFPE